MATFYSTKASPAGFPMNPSTCSNPSSPSVDDTVHSIYTYEFKTAFKITLAPIVYPQYYNKPAVVDQILPSYKHPSISSTLYTQNTSTNSTAQIMQVYCVEEACYWELCSLSEDEVPGVWRQLAGGLRGTCVFVLLGTLYFGFVSVFLRWTAYKMRNTGSMIIRYDGLPR